MADISLVNVCKTYKGGQNAVKDFNLDIKDRELIIFVGPSGCGKSTTLRMIAGLEDISSGELWMDDCLMNMVEPKNRNLSMVFQNYALYPHMTVYENMAFGLRVRRIPSGEIDARVREAARILEISHLLDRRPAALSGGQKQRVAIGSVIVRKPKAYLMDEPLSNLDAKLRAQMRVEIAKLHKQLNATIIYVTHDQVEAMTLGTRIVVMNRGMIQQVAPPAELYRNPVNKFVAGFIGSPTMNFLNVDVLEEDGTVWLLGQGWRLPLEGYQASKLKDKGYTGKRITLGIRPEDLHQEECSGKNGSSGLNGNGSGWIGAYISVREMLGSEVLLHGNTGDTGQLSARMPASCRVKPGEFLRLYVDMPQIKLFNIQTEENILFD
ncbi:ABC transporter ATP-binding protein [Enterocloster clostridioformis]|uniref:ABC transporter ATP-binding protein n=1 Tax=Enterocloster clostridioformis TaxID=1531 RepID=UPI00080C8E1A|nr:sn-glycerol-3-phosphate ABC transporter ATP-binding protein UgpC [Enterocloster clostridioformis]ANU46890.1 ABC transporter ATP-binding protein [Lachnoclostridium sp. YL32]NDO26968.1 sn-glycerol-3-phosphate ABC transporter ATP-binding protein UgpC [Enterocloster clostridioformis]OXE62480.1 ABC transporter ATP-binding protein [Enterocloster clostridioformis]QQQ98405.1 sn-glycerol-3-phosphate ABC transporter ATP-binding protein UgpC [Enterocloster clostridioformis]